MRAATALAILIATTSTAFAGGAGGFDIVIPGRPGVPIIINGVDASYAVVEGEWGLGKGEQVQPTIYGGRYIDPHAQCRSLLSERRTYAGLRAARNSAAGQSQAAAARGELSAVMVGAIDARSSRSPPIRRR